MPLQAAMFRGAERYAFWRSLLLYLLTSALITSTKSLSTCSFSFLGASSSGDLGEPGSGDRHLQLRSESTCSCTEFPSSGKNVLINYSDGNENLVHVCGPFGVAGSLTGAGGINTISLTFSGGEGLVMDGALLSTPTAAKLNLAAANGPTFPLLHFYKVNGLILRNLIFRDLDISGPLILIQDCANVTIQNVTLLRVADVRDLPSPSSPFVASVPSSHPTAPSEDPTASSTQSQLGGNAMAGSSAGALPSDPLLTSRQGGAIWLQNVSAARLESVGITSFRHNSSRSSLHGLLVAASRNISASGLHVYGFNASSDAVTETASSSAVMVERSTDISVINMDCSLSEAACGPCLTATDSSLIVASSNFSGNRAENRIGGAMCLKSEHSGIESKATVVDAVFSKNTAAQGGAIALLGRDGYGAVVLEVRYSFFDRNNATARGGDVYISEGGRLFVHSSTFNYSSSSDGKGGCVYGVAANATLINSSFIGCTADEGGALWFSSVDADSSKASTISHIVVDECAFTDNNAFSTGGGLAAFANHLDNALRLNVTVTRSNFTHNRAATFGGALWLVVENATEGVPMGVLASARLHIVKFRGNTLNNGAGGALFGTGYDIELDDGEFTENGHAWASDMGFGGAMSVSNCFAAIRISNVKYQDNDGHYGGALGARSCSLTLQNVEFVQNSGRFDGGGMYVDCSDGGSRDFTHALSNVTFRRNNGKTDGGGLFVACGDITLTESSLIENSANLGGGMKVVNPIMDFGGANNALPHVVLRRVNFMGNSAVKGGGLMGTDVRITMEAVDFVDNMRADEGLRGGGMFITRCPTSIQSMTCKGNRAREGGAAYINLCNATMRNVTFEDNNATDFGGALMVTQVLHDLLIVNISSSTFKDNNAINGKGGALKASNTIVVATDVAFLGNSGQEGGAVHLEEVFWAPAMPKTPGATAKVVHFSDCQFHNNSAATLGGAIFHSSSALALSNCSFLDNTAVTSGAASGDRWSSNSGGAIYALQCKERMLLSASELGRNRADEMGGAIALMTCGMTVEGSYFYGNMAKLAGGAVAAGLKMLGDNANGVQLLLKSSNLTGNIAAMEAGGSVFVESLPLTIEDCRLEYNTAIQQGGAVYIGTSSLLNVSGTIMRGNEAGTTGGAIHAQGVPAAQPVAILRGLQAWGNRARTAGGALWLSGWKLQLNELELSGNSVSTATIAGTGNAGGAMYVSNCIGNSSMSDASYFRNVAYQGGALYVELCSMVVKNSTFGDNNATGGDAGAIAAVGINDADTTSANKTYSWEMTTSTFSSNRAGGRAGALKAYHIGLSVSETHFLDNSAELEGGAVHLEIVPPPSKDDGDGQLVQKSSLFKSCNFQRNNASNSGGAIYQETSAVHLSDCKFYDNSAGIGRTTASSAAVAQGISTAGGAIFAASCSNTMEIWNCELGRNQADGMGGGMSLLTCETRIESSNLIDNVGKLSGGGVAAGHQATTIKPQGPPLIIKYCNLTGNKGVKQDGGAIHAAGVPLLLHDCRFLNNKAHGQGGALFSSAAPLVLLTRSTFARNTVDLSGGAAMFESPNVVQVESTTVMENTAGLSGGGLALYNAHCCHLEDVNLAANSATQGGGVHVVMTEITTTPAGDGLDCQGEFRELLGSNWSKRLSDASQTVIQTKKNDVVMVATNITAVGNLARLNQGGAVSFEAIRGSVLLDNFVAHGNRARDAGGGIAISKSLLDGATVYLSSSDLRSNAAVERGGALALDGSFTHQQAGHSQTTCSSCSTAQQSQSLQVVVINTTLQSNTAGLGGALSLQQLASVALHNCVLESNVADGGGATAEGSGGSVHAYACKWLLASETRIEASLASEGNGGGIYTEGCNLVMLSNVRLRGNNASRIGGAAFLSGSSDANAVASLAYVSGGRMDSNTAGGDDGDGGVGRSRGTVLQTGSAGALYLGGSMTALVDQTLFDGNVADAQGGAVGIDLDCPLAPDASAVAASMSSSANVTPWLLQQQLSRLSYGILELPIAANSTIQAMQQAASRSTSYSCWTAVLKEPRLWGNLAGGSGGGVFSTSPYTLAMICGDNWASRPTPGASTNQQLAGLVTTTTSRVASSSSSREVINVDTGQAEVLPASDDWNSSTTAPYMGLLPRSDTVRDSCFWRPQNLVTAVGDSGEETIPNIQEEPIPNRAGSGYGDAVATAPKAVVLVAIGEGEPALTYMGNRLGVIRNAPKSDWASSENGTSVMAVGSGSSGAGSDNISSLTNQGPWWPLWMSRAVLELHSRRALHCCPGQECRLIMPTNVAVGLNVSIFDATNLVVNDTGELRPVVRAIIASSYPSRRAELLGNPLAQVISGSASLEAVRVHARKGNYTLTLTMDVNTDFKVTPLKINVTVPPCSLGELPLDNGYVCSKCPVNTFSLRVDTDDSYNGHSQPVEEDCATCPYHAICTGGAVVVPEQGYWHSAANSTIIHQCPNMNACRSDNDEVNDELLRCQERWYAYFGEARRLSSLLRDPTGGTSLVGIYVDLYRKVAAVPNNTYNGSLYTPLAPKGTFDGFLLDCALWGVQDDDPLSYMQKQCSEGYSGRLCATCASSTAGGKHYALFTDLTCSACFSRVASAFISLAFFVGNTAWLGFSVLMTFMTDYTLPNEEGLPAADLLKVLVVHYQFFLIVTRININWPNSIVGLQAVVGSIAGSVKQVYSPSCFWPGADSATQATIQVLAGLLMPTFSVIVVMFLWTLRYMYWNQRGFYAPRSSSLPRTQSQALSGFSGSPSGVAPSTLSDAPSCITPAASLPTYGSGVAVPIVRTMSRRGSSVYLRTNPAVSPSRSPPEAASLPRTGTATSYGVSSVGTLRYISSFGSLSPLAAPAITGRADTAFPTVCIRLSDDTQEEDAGAALEAAGYDSADGELTPAATAGFQTGTVARYPAAAIAATDAAAKTLAAHAATAGAFAAAAAAAASLVSAAASPPPSVFALAQIRTMKSAEAKNAIPKIPEVSISASGNTSGDDISNSQPMQQSASIPMASVRFGNNLMTSRYSAGAASSRDHTTMHRSRRLGSVNALPPTVNPLLAMAPSDGNSKGAVPPAPDTAADAGAGGEGSSGLFRLFSKRESLSFVDANMSLMSQMFLVLMVTSFVLMPTWATEALSIFSCYKLDDGSGEFVQNQRATWPYGYWMRDMNQECYTGRHLHVWLPVGVIAVVVLCLAMPVTCATLMYHYRKRLDDVKIVQVYGFLYRSYKPKYFFWESMTQAQTLLLVVVEVFGRTLWVLHQALVIEVMLLAFLMVNTFFSPLVHDQLTSLQLLSLGTLCLTVVLGLFTSLPLAELSMVSENLLGALILLINCLVILGFLVLFVVHVLPTLKKKASAVASHLREGWSRLTPMGDGQSSIWNRLSWALGPVGSVGSQHQGRKLGRDSGASPPLAAAASNSVGDVGSISGYAGTSSGANSSSS